MKLEYLLTDAYKKIKTHAAFLKFFLVNPEINLFKDQKFQIDNKETNKVSLLVIPKLHEKLNLDKSFKMNSIIAD